MATKSIHSKQYAAFLKILVRERKSVHVTQQELASRLGKPQSYVSKIESAERRMDIVEFLAISSALGLDPCDLIEKLAEASR